MTESRDQRIARCMEENKDKSSLEASRGYCAALVDGMMAVEGSGKQRNIDKILAAGASIIIRPSGNGCVRFLCSKYAVGIEYRDLRNGLVGDDLEEIFARALDWIGEVDFCSGSQWTAEQLAGIAAS